MSRTLDQRKTGASLKLFREEALTARRSDGLGSIRLHAPRQGWLFFIIGLATLAATFIVLFYGRYTRHERAEGILVPSSGLLNITTVFPGLVDRVLVQEGSKVRAGQVLVEISGEQGSAAIGNTRAAIGEQLREKRESLHIDSTQQTSLLRLQQQDLMSRVVSLQKQMAELGGQIALQEERANESMSLYRVVKVR